MIQKKKRGLELFRVHRFSALAAVRKQPLQMYFASFTSGFIFSIGTFPLPFCRGVFHALDKVELSTKLTPESQENNVEDKIMRLEAPSGSEETVNLINLSYR